MALSQAGNHQAQAQCQGHLQVAGQVVAVDEGAGGNPLVRLLGIIPDIVGTRDRHHRAIDSLKGP